ncbi:hypothetical protein HK102_001953, partial [Quaeritorhiza haematococci]
MEQSTLPSTGTTAAYADGAANAGVTETAHTFDDDADVDDADGFLLDDPSLFNILMPSFSGSDDKYLPPHVALPETQPISPASLWPLGADPPMRIPLFRSLPWELVPSILRYLDKNDAQTLLWVDRASCQLARSILFKEIVCDFSQSSIELLSLIASSASKPPQYEFSSSPPWFRVVGTPSSRQENHDIQQQQHHEHLHIGLCVRKLTIETNSYAFSDLNHMDEGDRELMSRRLTRASQVYFKEYLPTLARLVVNLMPNLEILAFKDGVIVPNTFLKPVLSFSPSLRHLNLDPAILAQDIPDLPPTIPLRSLRLNCFPELTQEPAVETAYECAMHRLSARILRACGPTLESLEWTLPNPTQANEYTGDLEGATFPQLRKLNLRGQKISRAAVNALMKRPGSALVNLSVTSPPYWLSEYLSEVHDEEQQIMKHLQTVSLTGFTLQRHNFPMRFLSSHAHTIRTLFLGDNDKPAHFIDEFLELLKTFTSLQALRFGFEKAPTRRNLRGLSVLGGVKMLWISAGNQLGLRREWVVDHGLFLKEVAGRSIGFGSGFGVGDSTGEGTRLKDSLEWIAFDRDTYEMLPSFQSFLSSFPAEHTVEFHEDFQNLDSTFTEDGEDQDEDNTTLTWSTYRPPPNYYTVRTTNPEPWDRWHLLRMQNIVELYLEHFPRLRF